MRSISVLTVALLFGMSTANSDESLTPSSQEKEASSTDVQARQDPRPETDTRDPRDFPRLEDTQIANARFSYWLPTDRDTSNLSFAITKLIVVVIAVFLWLRVLSLCNFEPDTDQLDAGSWVSTIFCAGLIGIVGSIVLPAYVPGVFLLYGSILVPFGRFKSWRNRHPLAEANPLRWKHLLRAPATSNASVPRGDKAVTIELPSGRSIGTSNANIILIPKSQTAATGNAAQSHRSHGSPGYQMALALIDDAFTQRATDLHINTKVDEVVIRERVDGALNTLGSLPLGLGKSVINVFKVMSDLNIADRRRSQDGSFRVDVNGSRLSLRVSSQGTQAGEKLSIRILDPAKQFSTLPALGMTADTHRKFTTDLHRSNGLILLVGATGAGKSTTACAALQSLDGEDSNILSIEDPIEYQIPSVDQIEVNYRAGQTFESALRGVLRQDADVIFIGEIRDGETARIACQAAMTGQLVIATAHANNAVSGAMRLVDLGVDIHNVANALRAVLSQTLVRMLCVDCRTEVKLSPESLAQRGIADYDGPVYASPEVDTNPCSVCNGRGYTRRTGVFELLEVTSKIRDLITDHAKASTITATAIGDGMIPLIDEGRRLVCEGVISIEEFDRVFDAS